MKYIKFFDLDGYSRVMYSELAIPASYITDKPKEPKTEPVPEKLDIDKIMVTIEQRKLKAEYKAESAQLKDDSFSGSINDFFSSCSELCQTNEEEPIHNTEKIEIRW